MEWYWIVIILVVAFGLFIGAEIWICKIEKEFWHKVADGEIIIFNPNKE